MTRTTRDYVETYQTRADAQAVADKMAEGWADVQVEDNDDGTYSVSCLAFSDMVGRDRRRLCADGFVR